VPGLVLAGGHLLEAAYLAHETQPENTQVRVSIAGGMPGCVLLDPQTPQDVLAYFRTIQNDLNTEASGTSFLDSFSSIPDITAAWLRERKEKSDAQNDEDPAAAPSSGTSAGPPADAAAKRSQAGYETKYWEFVQLRYAGHFAGFSVFKEAKACLAELQRMGAPSVS
jgi:hypothetical protein